METQNHFKLSLLFIFLLLAFTSASVSPSPSPSTSEWDDNDDYPTTPPPPPAPCNTDDRNVLLKIKEAFNNSDIFDTWKPGTDCCNGWDFVECDSTTGRVNSFNFFGNTPYGRNDLPTIFPSIIGNLSYLTSLVFKNNVTGPIPASLANLRRLLYLELTSNRLSGPIPSFITDFKDLFGLALTGNQLTGTIPAKLAQLPNLNFISLGGNKLSGRIPEGLFSLFKDPDKNGVYLFLGSNKLKGQIPRSFATVNFSRLELQDNMFTGDASFLFGKDKWLSNLDLSGNNLSFDMSKLEVPSAMITLLLNNNNLYGSLPGSLVNVTILSYFNVSYNQLCGQIPVGGRLQQFDEYAYSHNKCLCGTPLPPCHS